MRLIDADALMVELGIADDCDDCERHGNLGCINCTWATVCDRIDDAPTVDAVPVVRCCECKHWGDTICERFEEERIMFPNDFCSYGERKDDDKSCDTCKHYDKGWDDAICDGCTTADSHWERRSDD